MKLENIILYYEKNEEMQISFEVCHSLLYRIADLELEMGHYQHHAPVCRLNKRKDESRSCWQYKKTLLAESGKNVPFCRTCPFGVTEYVMPVCSHGTLLGVFFLHSPSAGNDFSLLSRKAEKCARVLAEFVRIAFESSDAVRSVSAKLHRKNYYKENCLLFIEHHFRENIGIGDLAAQLHVNANYLSGVIRRSCGKTFRRLLTERRLSEARLWLRSRREFSIIEIAFRCGFQDGNYFSTVFRRHYGIPPGVCRDQKSGTVQNIPSLNS